MAVSYNNLWKLMIDKKINKSEICKTVRISSTMAKMTNEEMVEIPILKKIVQNWIVILVILWNLKN